MTSLGSESYNFHLKSITTRSLPALQKRTRFQKPAIFSFIKKKKKKNSVFVHDLCPCGTSRTHWLVEFHLLSVKVFYNSFSSALFRFPAEVGRSMTLKNLEVLKDYNRNLSVFYQLIKSIVLLEIIFYNTF